jgi:hypothetical protein
MAADEESGFDLFSKTVPVFFSAFIGVISVHPRPVVHNY